MADFSHRWSSPSTQAFSTLVPSPTVVDDVFKNSHGSNAELAERHWNELLSAEANVGLIMEPSMEVDQLSSVHHRVLNDTYFRDAVKNDVLLIKYARKQDDVDNSLVPNKIGTKVHFRYGQSSPVKHIFNYTMGGERPPINLNKMDQLDYA
ncbi:hypothetical protein TRIUR3_19994 [Triticum urartu]|uniref:Uncharacterized protein n=1 Tax=Triticum urartu TaxID=4572 RepID=M7YX43_TRIUA|nr:hypothetical protein TRIUR3_19994 [Triticum urartu]